MKLTQSVVEILLWEGVEEDEDWRGSKMWD